jgi:predicted ATP-grasp superfamily ATP-dependent carboligase
MVFSLVEKHKLLLVEELPGQEYSIDCIFNNTGELLLYGVRQRTKTLNGICSIATIEQDKDKEFLEVIKSISKNYLFKYCINIQLKRDISGKLKLLEINPRMSGSLGSFIAAGCNIPILAIYPLLNTKETDITCKFDLCKMAHRVSFFKGDINV